jgi:hypothetical protein
MVQRRVRVVLPSVSPSGEKLWLISYSCAARNSNMSGLMRFTCEPVNAEVRAEFLFGLCGFVFVMAYGQLNLRIFQFFSFIRPTSDFAMDFKNITGR